MYSETFKKGLVPEGITKIKGATFVVIVITRIFVACHDPTPSTVRHRFTEIHITEQSNVCAGTYTSHPRNKITITSTP